jgi:ribonuclease-3
MLSIQAHEIALRTIDTEISRLEEIIGYDFAEKLLGAEALQMRAPRTLLYIGGTGYYVNHNERLEQIGDRVLDAVLAKAWYEARDEHGMTNHDILLEPMLTRTGNPRSLAEYSRMQLELVTNKGLAKRGYLFGLDKCVIKGWGTLNVGTEQMANAFEAIIGAVYIDAGEQGLAVVRTMLEHLGFFEHPMLSVKSFGPHPPSSIWKHTVVN